MTLPVPLSQLNAGTAATQAAELAKRQRAYAAAVNARRSARALLAGDPRNRTLAERNRVATINELRMRDIYGRYRDPAQQYASEYQKLSQLTGANQGLSNEALTAKATAFDPTAARQRVGAQSQLDALLTQLGTSRQQLMQDYATNRAETEARQPDVNRALLSGFAGRGMAYSSGYGDALGRTTADYARRLAALDTGQQRGLAAADASEAQGRAAYQRSIADILFDQANRMAQNAGTLGLAGSDVPYWLEILRRRGVS